MKAQISVSLAQKTANLNLVLSATLYRNSNPIFHSLMQNAVSNTSCHWQKKAGNFPHNPTSPSPLLMLAQVQYQQRCHIPGAWAPAPHRVPRQPWAGGTENKHPVSQPASPPCPQARPFPPSVLSPSWAPLLTHIFPPRGAVVWDSEGLADGLHLSPRGGGFTEPSIEIIWS